MIPKVRMAMIGGGEGAFIGAIHRHAAQLDSMIELVCGAFSSNADSSVSFGKSLGLSPNRCYADYASLLREESKLPASERAELVSVVTPNHVHFPVCKMALELGFHVVCDKPVTVTLEQAQELAQIANNRPNQLFAVTYTYTAYPMVREARERIAQGQLGQIRKVIVEYTQGWLANQSDGASKQAKWRLDPSQAGLSGCMADIGVHAANLAEFVSGANIAEICAQLKRVVDGRQLDDDGMAWLKFDSGATGSLIASQVMTGEENNLSLRIYGDKAGLEWRHSDPNSLWLKYSDASSQRVRSGVGSLSANTLKSLRAPAGHPEGYLEAFANLYKEVAQTIRSQECDEASLVPTIADGLRSMAFIEAVVESSQAQQAWVKVSAA